LIFDSGVFAFFNNAILSTIFSKHASAFFNLRNNQFIG